VKLGATGYIIPFMFVFAPSLLMIGDWHWILLALVTAVIGVTCLAASLHGYLLRDTLWWERLLLFGAAIALIKPGWQTDLLGLGLLGVALACQRLIAAPKVGEAPVAATALPAPAVVVERPPAAQG
jgi:TRAP-type uncharacterized transport system fused permease subunit